MTQHVTDQDFTKVVLESKIPVFVDFYAEWCGPCKMMAPFVDEFAGQYEGKVLILKLNVDEAMDSAQKYGVMSIPTFISFKNGEVVDTAVGGMSKDTLQEKIEALL